MDKTFRVFISSTKADLEEERKQVELVLNRMRTTNFVGMEYFGSDERTPKKVCLAQVRTSHIYLGILGHRYGSIDSETGKSFTELEYREAGISGIPRLIYLKKSLPEGTVYLDSDPVCRAKLDALKAEVTRDHVVTFFADALDLAVQVAPRLHRVIVEKFFLPDFDRIEDLVSKNSYPQALSLLQEGLKYLPDNPKANLLYAIILLGGKNAELLRPDDILQVQSRLANACASNSPQLRLIASVALALVKYDFYRRNGIADILPPSFDKIPRLDEILKELNAYNLRAIDRTLLRHFRATDEALEAVGISLTK